jgi:hypothetical protein
LVCVEPLAPVELTIYNSFYNSLPTFTQFIPKD